MVFWSFVIFGLISSPSHAEPNDNSYAWPIEGMRQLSSNFAEHRSFRFHSGIDIRTQMKTGYKVVACQSGYVYRLYTSWYGYGKAVYLKLDNGRFAVYGHLSDFLPSIKEVVTERQLDTKNYKTDIFLKENEIRVKKGELIGYSGESGWGAPHLHFELRDSLGNPINPLVSGFSINDRVPPVMQYLALRLLGIGARINGSTEPVILSLFLNPTEKAYKPHGNPIAEGQIGLELCVHDKMDKSGFNLGIHRLELYLDDSLLFCSRYDKFSFEKTHMIELDRDYELRKKRGKNFYKLFVDAGNDLPIYDPAGGRINSELFKPGPHQVKIRAFDAAGNSSVLVFSLIFDQSPSILSCRLEEQNGQAQIKVQFADADDMVQEVMVEKSSPEGTSWEEIKREKIGSSRGEYVFPLAGKSDESSLFRIKAKDSFGAFSEQWYLSVNPNQLERGNDADSLELTCQFELKGGFFIFDVELNQPLREMPGFSLKYSEFDFDPLFQEQTSEKSYRLIFPFFLTLQREMTLLIEGINLYGDRFTLEKTIPVDIVTKSGGGIGVSADGKAKVEFPPNAVYDDINVTIQTAKMDFKLKHKPVGNVYSFEPSTVPLNGRAKISLQYPEEGCDPQRLGLYELTGERSWRFIDQEVDISNKTVGGEVRYLSVYTLLEDTLPPKVSRVSISPAVRINEKRPKITAVVKDDLSGIGREQDIVVEIDGNWMIPEYDPEKEILSTRPLSPLTSGKHVLSISVKDRSGNQTKIEREFFVVGK